jgi:thiol-disulfide isomerase/thioredoxin
MSCPPCVEELPLLISLNEKYKQRGLITIGVNSINQNINDINYFVNKNRINYPVIIGTNELLEQYSISAYPTTYLINKDGKVIFQNRGTFDMIQLEKVIQDNL